MYSLPKFLFKKWQRSTQLIVLGIATISLLNSCSKKDDTISTTTPTLTSTLNVTQVQKTWNEIDTIFLKYYPIFFRRNVNYDIQRANISNQITSSTTDIQLFEILKTFLNNTLKDNHTKITFANQESTLASNPTPLDEILKNITPNLINFVYPNTGDIISMGELKSNTNIGYIRANSFNYDKDIDTKVTTYKSFIDDKIKTYIATKSALIIDLRENGGGLPGLATALASYFISTDVRAYRQRYKIKLTNDESALSPWVDSPSNDFKGYQDSRESSGYAGSCTFEDDICKKNSSFYFGNKKIILLVSVDTFSSGEVFTGILNSQANVTIVGATNTGGGISSFSTLTLKTNNQWKVQVSIHDALVTTKAHPNDATVSVEGTGFTPDYKIPVTATDVTANTDPHITKAIQLITSTP